MIAKLKMKLSLASRKSSFENGPKSAFEIHNEYNDFNDHPTPRELPGYDPIEDWIPDTWIQELKLRFDKPIVFIYGDERAISPEQQLFLDELKGRFEQESFHYEFFCGSEAEVVVFFNLKDFLNRTLHLPTLSRARKLLVLIDEPKIDIDMETTQFLGKALKQELVTCFSKSGDQIMRADGYRKRIDEQEYSTIAKKKLYVIEDMVPNFNAVGTLP